jgi:hypothetical protein
MTDDMSQDEALDTAMRGAGVSLPLDDNDLDLQYEAVNSVMRTANRVAISMLTQHSDAIVELAMDRFEEGHEDYGDEIWGLSIERLTLDAQEEAADLLVYIAVRILKRIAMHSDAYDGQTMGEFDDDRETTLHALRSTLDLEARIEQAEDQGQAQLF